MAFLKYKISPNLNAFLDTIAYAEGTSTSKITRHDGYDIIVTGLHGPERFDSYYDHPFANRHAKLINAEMGLYSSASGRYQHLIKHWEHYKRMLKLPDFSPESQDLWAIHLIRERHALPIIEAGYFDEAVAQVSNLWASLPGANYPGQKMRKLDKLREIYVSKGGKLWKSEFSLESSQQPLPRSSVLLNTEVPKPEPKPTPKIEPSKPTSMLEGLFSLLKRLLPQK